MHLGKPLLSMSGEPLSCVALWHGVAWGGIWPMLTWRRMWGEAARHRSSNLTTSFEWYLCILKGISEASPEVLITVRRP